MTTMKAVVLLSGGLDSTAALAWAIQRYLDVRAFAIDYGQPNRDNELAAAKRAAEAFDVHYTRVAIADALRPSRAVGLMAGETAPDTSRGLSRSFVPGRNLLFVTTAAAHGCAWWDDGFDIVVGAVAEDQASFPDCRPITLAHLAHALQLGCSREIGVRTPWAGRTKREVLYATQPHAIAFEIVRRSWSCYDRVGPCGACGACVKRAAAFAELGVEDLCASTAMHGGDPHR